MIESNLMKDVEQFINSQVSKHLSKYKAYTQFHADGNTVFDFCLITGSEAKKHYGFQLPNDKNWNERDVDIVLSNEYFSTTSQNSYLVTDIMEVLQESTEPYLKGWTGVQSSVPDFFEPTNDEFKKPIYHFFHVYRGNMRYIEVFEKESKTQANDKFVDLATLIRGAQAWGRPKDLFFLEQVKAIYPFPNPGLDKLAFDLLNSK
jgi:hypothetical protein